MDVCAFKGCNRVRKYIRGLLCQHCNTRIVPYYEKLPAELRNWPHLESYLTQRFSRSR